MTVLADAGFTSVAGDVCVVAAVTGDTTGTADSRPLLVDSEIFPLVGVPSGAVGL